jgi:hypothetical protein
MVPHGHGMEHHQLTDGEDSVGAQMVRPDISSIKMAEDYTCI